MWEGLKGWSAIKPSAPETRPYLRVAFALCAQAASWLYVRHQSRVSAFLFILVPFSCFLLHRHSCSCTPREHPGEKRERFTSSVGLADTLTCLTSIRHRQLDRLCTLLFPSISDHVCHHRAIQQGMAAAIRKYQVTVGTLPSGRRLPIDRTRG
jgi:hypothetical protein